MRLEDALLEMEDGDLLLYKSDGIISSLTRGEYCHAAMFAHCNTIEGEHTPCVLELAPFQGGTITPIQDIVEKYNGKYHWFKANRDNLWVWNPNIAVESMKVSCSKPYGYKDLLRVVFSYIPFVRWFYRAIVNDSYKSKGLMFCSQAVSEAYAAAGVDVVPNLANCCTEPNDLARSLFFEYMGALGDLP